MARGKKGAASAAPSGIDREFVSGLVQEMNKASDGHITVLGDGGLRSEPTEFISTGVLPLDLALGGGLPVGRIIEAFGEEATGKSLLALQIGGQIQQVGGVVGLAESEEALTLDFAKRMAGIDVDQVINIDVDSLEQMFKEGEDFVRRVQAKAKANKIKPPIVGWLTDSLAGYPTQAELETPVDQSTATAIAARKIRLSFRKLTKLFAGERVVMVFTNHQTANIASGPFGGRKWTTYGGSGPRFWASVRLKLDVIGQLKSKNRQTGVWVRATIIKNRQDPPGMKIDYPIRWGTGIDNVWATIRWLKDQKRLGTTSGKVSWDGKSMNEVDLVKAAYRDPVLRAALEEEMRAMFKVLRDAMMADGSSDPEELEDEVEGYGDDDAEAGDGDVEGEA